MHLLFLVFFVLLLKSELIHRKSTSTDPRSVTQSFSTAEGLIHLSDIVVGCSSMNSSGAGTNMLTVLGAERRLVFVGPAKDRNALARSLISFATCFPESEYIPMVILLRRASPVSQVQMLCGALD